MSLSIPSLKTLDGADFQTTGIGANSLDFIETDISGYALSMLIEDQSVITVMMLPLKTLVKISLLLHQRTASCKYNAKGPSENNCPF